MNMMRTAKEKERDRTILNDDVSQRFGHPRFVAHAYPPHRGAWWEGSGMSEIQHRLSIESPFIGRSDETSKLESTIASDTTRRKLTVVKGIAGIGYGTPPWTFTSTLIPFQENRIAHARRCQREISAKRLLSEGG